MILLAPYNYTQLQYQILLYMLKLLLKYKATTLYICFIVLANALFACVPPIAFLNRSISPADTLVGCIYMLRDFSQREIKSYVLLAMLAGGFLSYLFANNTVASASLVAFFVGEFIDWAIFTWTKKPLSQRLLLSSLCSCPVDTVIFLGLLGRLTVPEFMAMTVFKVLGIFWVWGHWKLKSRKSMSDIISPTSIKTMLS